MLLSVLCRSGNQTPGFDWTKLWMKIHYKEQKVFVFLQITPVCELLTQTAGSLFQVFKIKNPEPQHRGATQHSQGQEQSQGRADPAAGGCWHPAAGSPHTALLQVTFHELSPLRSQHSRDQIPEWQPKRRWEQLVSATHQHL